MFLAQNGPNPGSGSVSNFRSRQVSAARVGQTGLIRYEYSLLFSESRAQWATLRDCYNTVKELHYQHRADLKTTWPLWRPIKLMSSIERSSVNLPPSGEHETAELFLRFRLTSTARNRLSIA